MLQSFYGKYLHIGKLCLFIWLMPNCSHLLIENGYKHLFWRFWWYSPKPKDKWEDIKYIRKVIFINSELFVKAISELMHIKDIGILGYIDRSKQVIYIIYSNSSKDIMENYLNKHVPYITLDKQTEAYSIYNIDFMPSRLIVTVSFMILDNGIVLKNRYGNQDIVEYDLAKTINILLINQFKKYKIDENIRVSKEVQPK